MRYLIFAFSLLSAALAGPASLDAQTSEGIHVRGVWTIEVVNPDGSIAHRETFENALQGSRFLLTSLPADITHVLDGIALDPCPVDPAPTACRFELTSDELVVPPGSTVQFPTLVVRTGLVASLASGPIALSRVDLDAKTCPPTISPIDCRAAPLGSLPVFISQPRSTAFTRKVLDTPITINDGQTVNIEVRVSMN